MEKLLSVDRYFLRGNICVISYPETYLEITDSPSSFAVVVLFSSFVAILHRQFLSSSPDALCFQYCSVVSTNRQVIVGKFDVCFSVFIKFLSFSTLLRTLFRGFMGDRMNTRIKKRVLGSSRIRIRIGIYIWKEMNCKDVFVKRIRDFMGVGSRDVQRWRSILLLQSTWEPPSILQVHWK